MAQIRREDPPYLQVVRSIRERIQRGDLQDGDPIPSARTIMREWNISSATATKVLAALKSEGLARAIRGVGTVVTTGTAKSTPQDRLTAIRRTGKIYPPGEYARIRSASEVGAPKQVADALGLSVGADVIRRQRVTFGPDDRPVSMSVSWFRGDLAETAPRLLETDRLPQGTPGYIEEMTGWSWIPGRDQVAAGAADAAEAADLGIEVGSPVLRGRNWIRDQHGEVIEYGESVELAGRWRSYDYEVEGDAE